MVEMKHWSNHGNHVKLTYAPQITAANILSNPSIRNTLKYVEMNLPIEFELTACGLLVNVLTLSWLRGKTGTA